MSRGRYPRRISVQAPPPDLEKRYLLRWNSGELYERPESFPQLDSESIFGNPNPLELEIGCGTGEFLCHMATRSPHINFLGLDLALKPLYRAVERASERALQNIRFIKTDFKLTYPLLVGQSLQVVYLHFPVPSTKNRHRKRRIFTPEFLDRIYLALAPGGRVSVMTDRQNFFKEMFAVAQNDPRYTLTSLGQSGVHDQKMLKSHTQRIWEARGHQIRSFVLEKKPRAG